MKSWIRSMSLVVVSALTAAAAVGGDAPVKGALTVGEDAAPLVYARVTPEPDSWFPGKTGYRIVLSDVAGLPEQPLGDPDKVAAGALHYVDLVVGHDRTVRKAHLGHDGFANGFVTIASHMSIDATAWGPGRVAGTVKTTGPREYRGKAYSFEVTFEAPVAE